MRSHLWWLGHFVSPPREDNVQTVLLLYRLVLEMELGIRSDHSNLPQVLQDLASIVLPVPKNGNRHGGSPPVLWVGLLLAEMNIRLIPADSDFRSLDESCSAWYLQELL